MNDFFDKKSGNIDLGVSVNDTILYYFTSSGKDKDKCPHRLMDKDRMNAIFDKALLSKGLSVTNKNKIENWKKDNKFK